MPTKLNLSLPGGALAGNPGTTPRSDAEAHRSALASWERVHGRPALNLGPLNVYWCDRMPGVSRRP